MTQYRRKLHQKLMLVVQAATNESLFNQVSGFSRTKASPLFRQMFSSYLQHQYRELGSNFHREDFPRSELKMQASGAD